MARRNSLPIAKTCNKCNHTIPIADFHRNSYSKDGFRSTCKECDRQQRILSKRVHEAKSPESETAVLGLRDTPNGEAICLTCRKLVPVGADGRLEIHYVMTIPSDRSWTMKPMRCSNRVNMHTVTEDS